MKDVRLLLLGLLSITLCLTSCSKDEDIYSCDPEVNLWAKSNFSDIRKMKVAEWYDMKDIIYQRAAYNAFTPDQRKDLWLTKLRESLALDWKDLEKKHIESLIYFIETNSQMFDNKNGVDDNFELTFYKWKEYAVEKLNWDKALIYAIIMTPEKLNINKELEVVHENPVFKSRSESDKLPLCNCNPKESGDWYVCSAWYNQCHTDSGVCEFVGTGCGDFWLYRCSGMCVSR